jgi:hypothetical protein
VLVGALVEYWLGGKAGRWLDRVMAEEQQCH